MTVGAPGVPEAPIVSIRDVTKHYVMGGEIVEALAGVSVDFERGGSYAIMGVSGSGKSTMLNLLGCLDRPTSGQYYLDGTDIGGLSDNALSDLRLRYLGFIFQSFNLIAQLTVRENIELPLFYLQWDSKRREQRAEELAHEVGLSDRLKHRPMELSGGQLQRVAIARALANDPTIILADEPTGNLDTHTSEQVMEILSGLNARGKTLIVVTHETEVAKYMGVRIQMRDGKIEAIES